MTKHDSLYTFQEACEYPSISRTALNKHVANGDIPVVRFDRRIRFRREDLDAFIEKSMR